MSLRFGKKEMRGAKWPRPRGEGGKTAGRLGRNGHAVGVSGVKMKDAWGEMAILQGCEG